MGCLESCPEPSSGFSLLCRVKARFSNLYKRLRHDILEDLSHYRSLSSTLKHYGGVKSDANLTPTTARLIRGILHPFILRASLNYVGTPSAPRHVQPCTAPVESCDRKC